MTKALNQLLPLLPLLFTLLLMIVGFVGDCGNGACSAWALTPIILRHLTIRTPWGVQSVHQTNSRSHTLTGSVYGKRSTKYHTYLQVSNSASNEDLNEDESDGDLNEDEKPAEANDAPHDGTTASGANDLNGPVTNAETTPVRKIAEMEKKIKGMEEERDLYTSFESIRAFKSKWSKDRFGTFKAGDRDEQEVALKLFRRCSAQDQTSRLISLDERLKGYEGELRKLRSVSR
jgi:hypothetical protein